MASRLAVISDMALSCLGLGTWQWAVLFTSYASRHRVIRSRFVNLRSYLALAIWYLVSSPFFRTMYP